MITEVRPALAFAQAEFTLLRRNTTALVTALLMPLLLVGIFALLPSTAPGAAPLLALTCTMALLFVVYYTLVTAVVARREEHTLKRLYTSSARPLTVLIALGLPLLGLLAAQVLLGVLGVGLLVGFDNPPAPWLLVPAALGGTAVWWVLALWSTTFTRSVEAAQLTTLPLLLVALFGSGASLPLALLPELAQTLAQFTPMYPVTDLIQLGFTGLSVTGEGLTGYAFWFAVARDVVVMAGWLVVGLAALKRSFRWEPRR